MGSTCFMPKRLAAGQHIPATGSGGKAPAAAGKIPFGRLSTRAAFLFSWFGA
jgi:hypothetical protein